MIGLRNKDSAFFEVSFPDLNIIQEDLDKSLISFSVIEGMGQIPTINLQIKDDNDTFSEILKLGVIGKFSWGCLNIEDLPSNLITNKINSHKIKVSIINILYEVYITGKS